MHTPGPPASVCGEFVWNLSFQDCSQSCLFRAFLLERARSTLPAAPFELVRLSYVSDDRSSERVPKYQVRLGKLFFRSLS